MVNLFEIFFLFCYFGCLCFGGGSALVPIYIDDLVLARGWMTLDQFGTLTAISQMTPGPIGVNAATLFGFLRGGVAGAALATLGLLLPSYFLVMIAVKSLQRWEKSRIVQGIMTGIRPATIGMILASLLIFIEMSVVTETIPWAALATKMVGGEAAVPAGFYFRPMAALIFAASALVLYKNKLSIMNMIFLAAAFGAFFCR